MATERIDVVVSERGARVVQRNIEDIGRAASGADAALKIFQRTLTLIGGAVGVRAITQMVDQYTNLQNRLRVVTTGQENLARVTQELYGVASRTRSSFASTVELYARLANSSKELGVSQQDLVTFTERLNQAIVLSGASSQEASAGIIQLAQGMASGRLQGDELRSVLEQLPTVADVIAKQLGVTRGELRKLGSEGKITARDILTAFKNADYIVDQFATTVPTVSQAFTRLHDAVQITLGQLDQSTGASRTFAEAVISIADNMDTVAKAITTLAAAFAVLVGPAVLGRAVSLFTGLWALLARHPIVLLVSAVVSAVVGFGQFNTTMDKTLAQAGKVVTVVDRLVATFAGARAYIEAAWADFPEWLASIFIDAVNGAVKWAAEGLNKVGDLMDKLTGRTGTGRIDIDALDLIDKPERFAKAGDAAAKAYQDAFNKVLMERAQAGGGTGALNPAGGAPALPGSAATEQQLRRLARELKRVREEADPTEAAWARLAEGQKTLEDAFGAGLITLNQYNDLNAKFYRALEDQLFPVQALSKEIDRQNQLLKLNSDERERQEQLFQLSKQLNRDLTQAETEELTQRIKRNQELKTESDLYEQIRGPQDTYTKSVDALLNLLGDGRISFEEYTKAIQDARAALLDTVRTAEGGFNAGLANIGKQFGDSADLIKQTMTDAFQGAEDALVNFVTTGKFSVKDLANSILQDLNRIMIRQTITAPLAQWLGGSSTAGNTGGNWLGNWASQAASSAGNWFSSLFGFATGGDFTVGGSGGIDSQLVQFRATPGERVSITKPGQPGGTAPANVSMTVYAQDANSFKKSRNQIMNELGAGVSRAQSRNR